MGPPLSTDMLSHIGLHWAAAKRIFIYHLMVTWLLANMDWQPIHRSWQEHWHFPDPSVEAWWAENSQRRLYMGYALGAQNLALAENYYFVIWEVEANNPERVDTLLAHAPYSYNPLAPDGWGFWWGQGGPGNSNPWKRVSMLAWYLYWLPPSALWWVVFGDLFWLRCPRWIAWILKRR